ncbi:hypothetical protein [Brevundimonas intermedia]|uniref:capsular polysaccharide export protein, LipB/KpsS family n=1 Tax=Brevundimonas intermedia TaxID=74315 RepID=UPI0014315579|nr:hypothetical protein [Brevundimonas intermedia]
MHLFATEPPSPDTILPETVWKQKLRGVAAIAIDLITHSGADTIFVPHGAEVISRILAVAATALERKLLFWESGFFPGYLYLDSQAPHFFRGKAHIDALPAPLAASTKARQFKAAWLGSRQSKYPQNDTNLETLEKWADADPRPILFLAGQVPTDANAVVHLKDEENLDELYQAILQHVPDSWRILYKPHPLTPRDPLADVALAPDRFLRLDVDLHDALTACKAVLVHSSNVGLEALLYGKPVLTLGRPIYEGRGLTTHLEQVNRLSGVLTDSGGLLLATEEAVLSFLDLLLDEALIADGDAVALQQRIRRTAPGAPQEPRKAWYGASVQALAEAACTMKASLEKHHRIDNALHNLTDEHRQVLERRIGKEALELHRFGGPPVPRIRYVAPPLPDLDAYLDTPARYLTIRLEDCIDPLNALDTNAEVQVFRVPTTQATPGDAVHVFQKEDIEALARQCGKIASIVGFDDAEFAHADNAVSWVVVFSAKAVVLPETGTAKFRPWTIPLDAFNLADDPRPRHDGFLGVIDATRHPLFGPFINVPSGVWQVCWRRPAASYVHRLARSVSSFMGTNALLAQVEWVEHINGEASTTAQGSFEAGLLTATAQRGAQYEFRFLLPPSSKLTSKVFSGFNGITLRQISR